jgi:hypothetical protein
MIFDALLEDLTTDITLEAHSEIKRSRLTCETCGTQCVEEADPQDRQNRRGPVIWATSLIAC